MRQAPPHYAIIGSGRWATHFSHYLDLSGISFVQWHRRSPHQLLDQLAGVSCVLILLSDEAIEPFMQEHAALLEGKTLVHASGALSISGAVGVHPLYSFSEKLYSLETYQRIVFAVDRPDLSFQSIFPGLGNHSVVVEPSEKPYYHAMCVMANNFTTLLWRKFFSEMKHRHNLDPSLIDSYLEQTFHNLRENLDGALTGPLARGDSLTIEKNIAALENDPYQVVYRSFVEAFNKEGVV